MRAALTVCLAGLLDVSGTAAAAPTVGGANDYIAESAWLCRPGRQDSCAADLTTTVIAPSGEMTAEPFAANPDAPIDCFYVYPTVSMDQTPNSDMVPGKEEYVIAAVQAARFTSVCRVFAPMYRQITLNAMLAGMAGKPVAMDFELAYQDVRAAWADYLARDNGGRGVVLIGHSQGAGMLTRLLSDEFDGKPLQPQLVSALLIGSAVSVPRGGDVGGTFRTIPACRTEGQTGCVISYAAFRDTLPPPHDAMFGVPGWWEGPRDPNREALCTNPADLADGEGELHSYFTAVGEVLGARMAPPHWVAPPASTISTHFVSTPGLVTARCVSEANATYLSVHVNADLADPRTDDIGGDIRRDGTPVAQWGLHLIDMPLTMGDLVRTVGGQGEAHLKRR